MNLKDCRDIAQGALAVMKVMQSLTPQRKLEVMAVAQTMVNIEAQNALRNTASRSHTPAPEDEV